MTVQEKIKSYYEKERPFKDGIALLREIVLKTELEESFKWSCPVYTLDNKNILGIIAFKSYFGIWFFNGVFLSDPVKVLENAREGVTKAMRHWKFYALEEVNPLAVTAYVQEAIDNQKKGMSLAPQRKNPIKVPPLLTAFLNSNPILRTNFYQLPPYKRREYCEYISEAKQEKTKRARLEKCSPKLLEGLGLNDGYRKN
ncbi:Uncharacterized conserved protein YdeI, YjbR/CyaY-like superfamily, DUF1801 family [Arenibacter nanhaiticus]|uniref:Uncharacterized conserved protein YdeI, YjbR/CyaY-like superfamily, DUF1801 family n=1 Tax=Arenibacter nanhaiticus TaxID=558155 RepID=A0A1M6BGW8_9FLAO|nr:YdeI/OmpD-associated family protein [Arenibacter nanhaiticus]SHI47828.1 Uncharacterized conserved protein YdeI, YjbR/CyaY-like superfamily, DUF1801 family [Arenibacter nanhaiticus]